MPMPTPTDGVDPMPALRTWVKDMRHRLTDQPLVNAIATNPVVAIRHGQDTRDALAAEIQRGDL